MKRRTLRNSYVRYMDDRMSSRVRLNLFTLTDLARYYQALPIVSPTVYAAAMNNPQFYTTILKSNHPCSVLESAKTLRNGLLFRDALILCLGPWSNPTYLRLADSELLRVASAAHSRICVKIAQAIPVLLNSLVMPGYKSHFNSSKTKDFYGKVYNLTYSCRRNYQIMLPAYYRQCFEKGLEVANSSATSSTHALQQALAPLLVNNLKMAPHLSAGAEGFEDHFLCKLAFYCRLFLATGCPVDFSMLLC